MTAEEPRPSPVARKAERMQRARRDRATLWRHLAHVGVLGWVFILPVVLGLFVGRLFAVRLGSRVPLLVGLAVGLATGGYGVWHQVRRSLEDEDDDQGSTP